MSNYDNTLNEINGKINRWHAFEHFIFLVAAVLTSGVVLTALDVWLRPRGAGRFILSGVWVALTVAGLVWLMRIMGRKRTPAATAAFLEKKFPQLDNHLINRVLFADESSQSSWLKIYLNEGVPMLGSLPLDEIKDRKLRKRGGIAVLAAALMLLLPSFVFSNNAWVTAMRRVLNPFAPISPPTFAAVVEVLPADKTIVQGDPVTLSVVTKGREGQTIDVELYPADDKRSTLRVGQIRTTDAVETNAYIVSKVSSSLQYRFLVGDAYPTDKYTIDTVPPLSLANVQLRVKPPAYTALPEVWFNVLTNLVALPAQSEISIQATCNRPVETMAITFGPAEEPMNANDSKKATWSTSQTVKESGVFTIAAKDKYGLEMRVPVRYEVQEDRSPGIRMIVPSAAKAVLPPNAVPALQFEVTDDYGIREVRVERVKKGTKANVEEAEEILETWTPKAGKVLNQKWVGTIEHVDVTCALRVVALDNADTPNRTVSQPIAFDITTLASQLEGEKQGRADARKSLGELIAKQRIALNAATRLKNSLPTFDEEPWTEVKDRQTDIRAYAATLAKTKDSSLGAIRVMIEKALQGPLPEAVSSLNRTLTGEADKRLDNATRATEAQSAVLRLLAQAESGMGGKSEISQTAAGVLSMLEGIKKGQTDNLRTTLRYAGENKEKLSSAIIDRQDNLAQDTSAMIAYCREEAKQNRDDAEFGKLMVQIADKAVELKIHPVMVDIAEVMDTGNFSRTIEPQIGVTNNLAVLMAFLNEWRETDTKKEQEDVLKTIQDAKQALKKTEELQATIVDALRDTGGQGDKTEKLDEDTLAEILELKHNMSTAVMQVAVDLQAFPDLEGVNELVTDLFQTYEEMKQAEGSSTNEVAELGLQKEDFILEAMAKTGKKVDEMEMWLMEQPDAIKRNTEQFDKDEMPTIGQVTMPEELQDIIGDLLEQEKEKEKEADDSVTNQGDANPDPGWGIAEGEIADYSAAGKSGNERPEHKDQDGRSQVGRQGMADGEVMARSGAINEGDEDMTKRRTQDSNQSGDVEEEGHTKETSTGGGKNSGYAEEKGMEGNESSTRRDTKVEGESTPEMTRSQLTRNAEATYAKAQLNNLKTYNLKKYIEFSKQLERLEKQNASPAMIAELTKKARRELEIMMTHMEAGISNADMGATSDTEGLMDDGTAASPDEAPAEYREMVSDYFKALGEMK